MPDRCALCLCSDPETFAILARAADAVAEDAHCRLERVSTAEGALQRLGERYVALLLLDLRGERAAVEGELLLDRLDSMDDVEARYGFHRILALVRGDGDAVDAQIAALGRRGVGHILRERGGGEEFAARVLARVQRLVGERAPPRSALCASGGGITGIYFELGALKCLDDVTDGGVNRFDEYFGISAGAVVSSLLANGYSVDEVMAGLAGVPGGRIPPLDLGLLKMGNLNTADIARRLRVAFGDAVRGTVRGVRRHELPDADALFLDATAMVGAPFQSDGFERLLRPLLEAPGATNSFDELPRPLFVGATDQDRREHVVFGSEGLRDVPISRAVQASLSINPAFSAVQIGERWFEDGAVTRTSDFSYAVARGATLAVVVDPFLPWVSPIAGEVQRRGVLYNVDQTLRSMSWTRFEQARDWILRRHPEVSSYTFVPGNTSRQLLSRNPMDHRPFAAIWRDAYLSTLRRIQHLRPRLAGDLAHHGFGLDTQRAEAVAARLEAIREPEFADFFPGRTVRLRRGPLAREHA
jgi:NTE family protein